jgi:transposase-like protein
MANEKMEPLDYLRKLLSEDNDATRTMLKDVAEALMSAEASSECGAEYGTRGSERVNSRNGYRERPWDTRAGTIALAIPKLRSGTYFPTWLLEPRRRAEKALTSVVVEAYVQGVSTRRVEDLVQSLGIEKMSKSQVSMLAKELDGTVKAFRERKLGRFPYLWLDAIVFKCREGGRIANVAALVAVGVNEEGRREVLGLDVVTSEDGAGWLAFLRGLKARGLRGVELVISDAHAGLKDAIHSVLRGAAWQRCRTHFMRNLLTKVPKSTQPFVATLVRSIFAQPDAESVREQYKRVVDQLKPKMRDAANLLDECREELLAFTSFPKEHWRQVWSNNPQERLNRELRRRTDVVGIFPNRESIIRLVGAVLLEMNDDWAVVRRYMTFEVPPVKEVDANDAKRILEAMKKSA